MDYPLFNIFVTTPWVFLWILWAFLLVVVFLDLFRDRGVGGLPDRLRLDRPLRVRA